MHVDRYRRRMLGRPKEADERWSRAGSALPGLELLPLLAAHVAWDQERSERDLGRSLAPTTRAAACAGP